VGDNQASATKQEVRMVMFIGFMFCVLLWFVSPLLGTLSGFMWVLIGILRISYQHGAYIDHSQSSDHPNEELPAFPGKPLSERPNHSPWAR
jgi:hypothetical protein